MAGTWLLGFLPSESARQDGSSGLRSFLNSITATAPWRQLPVQEAPPRLASRAVIEELAPDDQSVANMSQARPSRRSRSPRSRRAPSMARDTTNPVLSEQPTGLPPFPPVPPPLLPTQFAQPTPPLPFPANAPPRFPPLPPTGRPIASFQPQVARAQPSLHPPGQRRTLQPPPGQWHDNPDPSLVVHSTTTFCRPPAPLTVEQALFRSEHLAAGYVASLFRALMRANMPIPPQHMLLPLARAVYNSKLNVHEHLHEQAIFHQATVDDNNYQLWEIPFDKAPGPLLSEVTHHSHVLLWAHATSPIGLCEILKSGQVLKAEDDKDYPTYGFFCNACLGQDYQLFYPHVIRRWYHETKNTSQVLICGQAVIHRDHKTIDQGGIYQEQLGAFERGAAHGRRTKHWTIREDRAKITGLWLVLQR